MCYNSIYVLFIQMELIPVYMRLTSRRICFSWHFQPFCTSHSCISDLFLIKLTHQHVSKRNCFDLFPRFCVLELFLRKESVIETMASPHVLQETFCYGIPHDADEIENWRCSVRFYPARPQQKILTPGRRVSISGRAACLQHRLCLITLPDS